MSSDPSLDQLRKRYEEVFGERIPSTSVITQQKPELLSMTGPEGLKRKLNKLKQLNIKYEVQFDYMKKDPSLVKKQLLSNNYINLESEIKILILNILNNHTADMIPEQKKVFKETSLKLIKMMNQVRTCKMKKESCVISGGMSIRKQSKKKQKKTKKPRKKRITRKRTGKKHRY